MKKLCTYFATFVVSTFVGLVLLDLGLGWRAQLKGYRNYQHQAMQTKVEDRITKWWKKDFKTKQSYFAPPHVVFLNTGFDDPNRMQMILETSQFPPNKKWQVPNFLLDEDIDYTYTVTTNSLGFRDQERTVEKGPKTFRIVGLGTYPLQGHGVNDNETYLSVVENVLNRKIKDQLQVEVWNGGRQGSSAIMGLARLKLDVMQYEPDLLIWDFGWVDLFLESGVIPGEKGEAVWSVDSTEDLYLKFINLVKRCHYYWLPKSNICKLMVEKFAEQQRPLRIENFRSVTKAMVDFAKENNLPVLMIRHEGVAIRPEVYQSFEDKENQIYFLDTTKDFLDQSPSEEVIQGFWARPNWLNEVGVTRNETTDQSIFMYRGDAIQYNADGYRVIGETIADYLVPIILNKTQNSEQ